MPKIISHYKYFGEEVRLRKRGIAAKQNHIVKYQINLLNDDGSNVNIDELASEYSIDSPKAVLAIREASLIHPEVYIEPATIKDAETGLIEFILPQEVRSVPAIYNAEIGIVDENSNEQDKIYVSNSFYVYNEPSNWTTKNYTLIPISEIRLSIRDSDAIENELINNFEYDVAEISYAATRTVQFWNEIPPSVYFFDTSTFPFRNLWLTGIQLFLFEIIEEHYRRNYFPHSSGGLAVDDKNKFRIYHEAWAARLQLFRNDVMRQKIRINAEFTSGIVTGLHSPLLWP
ncbi:MAG: hypothetical protein QXQ37_04100 [Nitrososphaerota archaeon]